MKVTLLSTELIIPSSSTPSDLRTYKLSYIDQQIHPHHIPFILYYSYHESTTITQSTMTTKLKTSLSKTLTRFYPLAGRLTNNQNAIDCVDQGVQFSVARVECDLMSIVRNPVIEELSQLVLMGSSYIEEQVAIQVNLFDCGGIAVGVCMSHRIADACSFSSFVSHWFALANGPETPLTGPVLDSAVLFPPMDSYEFNRTGPTVVDPFKKLVTKRFLFSSLAIKKLKHEAVKSDSTLVGFNPTRVEVVTALIWKCMAAVYDCKASVAFHVVNFRRKMVPSLPDHQFGNLFQMASAVAHETTDMGSLVGKVRGSFGKIDGEYLKSLMGENGVEVARGNFREIRKYISQEGVGVFRFSSWCRFEVNESDFGWGKPVWISGTDYNNENSIMLMDSRLVDGIEAWVVLSEDNMHKLEQDTELQAFVGYAAC
ncbi:hypothetical protein L2E82_46423 [Cichorium intybus]|uniref:Uncharacterized protein n=1 Tax=Cichorium intybus TaxID=13427 RepID=A0ACB8YT98_CICIN|nr:hypothetical protein L2E82_46423 [Cichorium intybus]